MSLDFIDSRLSCNVRLHITCKRISVSVEDGNKNEGYFKYATKYVKYSVYTLIQLLKIVRYNNPIEQERS